MCVCCMTIRPQSSHHLTKTKIGYPTGTQQTPVERHSDWGGQLITDGRTATMAYRSVDPATGELIKTFDDKSDAEFQGRPGIGAVLL